MGDEKIDVLLSVSAEDYRRVLLWQARSKLILLSTFVGVMVLIFAGATLFFFASKPDLSPLLWTPLLIPVFIGTFSLWQLFRSIGKQAADATSNTVPTRFVFSSSGFTTESALASSQIGWGSLAKIHETSADFVLYPQKRIFMPIPKRFFQKEQIDQIRRFISEAVQGPEITLSK